MDSLKDLHLAVAKALTILRELKTQKVAPKVLELQECELCGYTIISMFSSLSLTCRSIYTG